MTLFFIKCVTRQCERTWAAGLAVAPAISNGAPHIYGQSEKQKYTSTSQERAQWSTSCVRAGGSFAGRWHLGTSMALCFRFV
jgi:hypothetical protein